MRPPTTILILPYTIASIKNAISYTYIRIVYMQLG